MRSKDAQKQLARTSLKGLHSQTTGTTAHPFGSLSLIEKHAIRDPVVAEYYLRLIRLVFISQLIQTFGGC